MASAVASRQKLLPHHPIEKGWKMKTCTEEKVTALFIEIVLKLAQEYTKKIEALKVVVRANIANQPISQDTLALLSKGGFFAQDFRRILLTLGKREEFADKLAKHQELMDSGAYYYGLPPKNFYLKDKKRPNGFEINPDVLPSNALESMDDEPFFSDCGHFLQRAVYKTLHIVFGTKKFNKIFQKTPLNFDSDTDKTSVDQFMHGHLFDTPDWSSRAKIGIRPQIKPGDWVYFGNLTDCQIMNPYYQGSAGRNSLCTQNNPHRYVSMGDQESEEIQVMKKLYESSQALRIKAEDIVSPPLLPILRKYDPKKEAEEKWEHERKQMKEEDFLNKYEGQDMSVRALQSPNKPIGLFPYVRRLNIKVIRDSLI